MASEELVPEFPSTRHHSSSGSYPLYLSGLGNPTSSNAAASSAVGVSGTHMPIHYGKVNRIGEGAGLGCSIVGCRTVYCGRSKEFTLSCTKKTH